MYELKSERLEAFYVADIDMAFGVLHHVVFSVQ